MYQNYFAKEEIITHYTNSIESIGLWNAEKYALLKYVSKHTTILDIGTGAGRVAFGLYELGYKNIIATDFCINILNRAIEINQIQTTNINFIYDDITETKLDPNQFDAIIFSFNGFIIIPSEEKRLQAIRNINKLLKSKGILILSTDNRRINKKYNWFWKDELNRWKENKRDNRISRFGEVIYNTDQGEMYFHHYRPEELVELLNNNGFMVLDDYNVGERYKESPEVLNFCGGKNVNHIWIAQKFN